jgi:hypothetical protein
MRTSTVILIILALAYAVVQHDNILIAAGAVVVYRIAQVLFLKLMYHIANDLHKSSRK